METQLFEVIFKFCEKFPGTTPFSLRKERAREFFEVFAALISYLRHEQKAKNKPSVIRKPAGDNWF